MVYNVDTLNMVDIGWTGENNATVISIDVKSWLGRWPDAQISLVVCRPKEDVFYPVVVEQKNHFAIWRVTLADVSIPGMGNAVLYAKSRNEDVIAKHPFRLRVNAALDSELKDPPEVGREWLEQVLDAADRAEAAQASYYTPKMDGFELVWEPSWEGLPALPKTNIRGEKGETGVGVASIQQTHKSTEDGGLNVWQATLTDGTQSAFTVVNGSKGSQGERGERGEPGPEGSPGKDGAPGSSGVYIGTEAPTDANVWIDPEGKGTETLPNPHPLVINGVSYDGSERVEVETESEAVLIERIVVEKDTVEITRNKEPDGTPYNFSAVTIRAKFPPSEKTGNLSIFFGFDWPAEIRNYMLNPYNATSERNGYSKCYLSNKRWRGGWWTCALGAGDYAQYYENPVQQEQFGVEDGYIEQIKFYHVSGIEAGTTFEIWGVRA